MKQIDYYKHAVAGLGLTVEKNGEVFWPTSTPTPATIGEDKLVLPIEQYLDDNEWTGIHPFHPLCENIVMGQSKTLHFMMQSLMKSMSVYYPLLVSSILQVAASEKMQSTIKDSRALDLCALAPAAKPDWLPKAKAVSKAIREGWEMDDGSKQSLIGSIYIARDKTIDGERYLRVATLDFPILEQMNPDKYCGVPMRKNIRKAIHSIYNYLLEPIKRQFVSNDTNPYAHAFFQAARELIGRYNEIVDILGDYGPARLDDKWFKWVDKLDELKNPLPKLKGNEGIRLGEEKSDRQRPSFDDLDVEIKTTSAERRSRREDPKAAKEAKLEKAVAKVAEELGVDKDEVRDMLDSDDEPRGRSRSRRDRYDDEDDDRRGRGRSRGRSRYDDDEDDRRGRSRGRSRRDDYEDDDRRGRGRSMRDSLRNRGRDDRRGGRYARDRRDRRDDEPRGRTMRDALRRR